MKRPYQRSRRLFGNNFGWTAALLCFVLISLGLLGCMDKKIAIDGGVASWQELNRDQQKRVMRQAVVPLAQSIFQSWQPERYSEITCTLCHGDGAEKEDFHIPNEHLPRLSGDLLLGTEFRNHPDTTRLKLDRLVPGMAEILGKKQFSLITRRGFGCYSCHLGPDGPLFGN